MIVGRTECGKTTFIQNLGRNKELFVDQTVQFTYPNNLDDFNYLIEFFMSPKMPESATDDKD